MTERIDRAAIRVTIAPGREIHVLRALHKTLFDRLQRAQHLLEGVLMAIATCDGTPIEDAIERAGRLER